MSFEYCISSSVIFDFFGVVLLGWFVNTLPNILKGLQKLIRMIQNVITVLTGYIEGVKDFLVGMGQDIQDAFQSLPKIDLNQMKTDADKATDEIFGGLTVLRKDLISSVNFLNRPQNLGLNPNDPEGLIDLEPEEGKENQENKSGDTAPDQTPPTGGTVIIQAMSSSLNLSKQEFILSAEAMGVTKSSIVFRHLIPNAMGPVIVYATLTVPQIMLLESFLSFLGLGVQPPLSSWGLLIRDGAVSMEEYWWLLIFPSLAFSLTLFSLNFIGDGLRDAIDPRTADS